MVKTSANDHAERELVAEQRHSRDAGVGGQRFADLVAVGASSGRCEQQPRFAQTPAHQVGGHAAQQQGGEHLGHVAVEAQHPGDARPCRAAERCRTAIGDDQHEGAGPGEADGDVRGEARAHHQLALLADVDQPGPTVDDGAETDEQDRGRHPERETPATRFADAAVEDRGVHVRPRSARRGDDDGRERQGDEQADGVQGDDLAGDSEPRTLQRRGGDFVLLGLGEDVLADVTHWRRSSSARAERGRRRRGASRRRSVRWT